jgi:hypothetical protein
MERGYTTNEESGGPKLMDTERNFQKDPRRDQIAVRVFCWLKSSALEVFERGFI